VDDDQDMDIIETKIEPSITPKASQALMTQQISAVVIEEDVQWVMCERCSKWRTLPLSVNLADLPEQWYCEMNKWDADHNNCDAPEISSATQTAVEDATSFGYVFLLSYSIKL
jgi:hypothetical protein